MEEEKRTLERIKTLEQIVDGLQRNVRLLEKQAEREKEKEKRDLFQTL